MYTNIHFKTYTKKNQKKTSNILLYLPYSSNILLFTKITNIHNQYYLKTNSYLLKHLPNTLLLFI